MWMPHKTLKFHKFEIDLIAFKQNNLKKQTKTYTHSSLSPDISLTFIDALVIGLTTITWQPYDPTWSLWFQQPNIPRPLDLNSVRTLQSALLLLYWYLIITQLHVYHTLNYCPYLCSQPSVFYMFIKITFLNGIWSHYTLVKRDIKFPRLPSSFF
jgi:hypothetical protein